MTPQSLPSVRAVHLDLKGLPPTEERLVALLDLFSALGYNAVLVEWEDTFPWSVDERFRSPTAYSPETVMRFAARAAELSIELIPLVQSLGHMETPLRLPEYAPLREQSDRCDCLNPLAAGARALVQAMVDDVLRLMPSTRHLHLGGDEAWAFATGPETSKYASRHGRDALYLHHIEPILQNLIGRGIRPLLWHDMMIHWGDERLRWLAAFADLVVWGYVGHPDDADHHFNTRFIARFHELGVPLWGAGAYKGADGMDADIPDAMQRLNNAQAWLDLHQQFGFRGLVATGWSRYSTHRVSNEPIEGALDTLGRIGRLWREGEDPGEITVASDLAAAGEDRRHARCRSALQGFSAAREAAWRLLREGLENASLAERDPVRRGSGILGDSVRATSDQIERLTAASEAVMCAFSGLVDDRWLSEYISVRIAPLRSQLDSLRQIVHAIEVGEAVVS